MPRAFARWVFPTPSVSHKYDVFLFFYVTAGRKVYYLFFVKLWLVGKVIVQKSF
jgi:hypothetical protein